MEKLGPREVLVENILRYVYRRCSQKHGPKCICCVSDTVIGHVIRFLPSSPEKATVELNRIYRLIYKMIVRMPVEDTIAIEGYWETLRKIVPRWSEYAFLMGGQKDDLTNLSKAILSTYQKLLNTKDENRIGSYLDLVGYIWAFWTDLRQSRFYLEVSTIQPYRKPAINRWLRVYAIYWEAGANISVYSHAYCRS